LDHYPKKYERSSFSLTPQDEIILSRYPWPGNVRELNNVIERAVLLSTEGKLELVLPRQSDMLPNHPFADNPTMDDLQRRYLRYIFEKTHGRIGGSAGAAGILGMKRTTCYTRMRKLGLNHGKNVIC
jgi:transcriptional regulator of acetoin/glycerol metabolism